MGGKLPIDRARESQHDPRQIEQQKQQFAQKEAALQRKAREHDDAQPGAGREDHGERDGGEDEA